jgi:adenosylmethionine-8-amino-7-oxononanoate aminotransferase
MEFDQGAALLHFAPNGAFGPGGNDLRVLERGEGPYVWDTHGNKYLDGLSSLFCAQIGYSYGEEMAAVAGRQLQTLAFNTLWGTAHPPALKLASKLAELAPDHLNHVFFTNGGSESVEAAWKLARQYHVFNGEPQRTKAIARNIAYHGVTLGALSFTGIQAYKEAFGRSAIETLHVANTNAFRSEYEGEVLTRHLLKEIEDTIINEGEDTIAVIIAEPVQNAGGCLTPPPGYWQGLRRIADRHGILLIADEVITGFGRIGAYFASARFDARPDLITTAKGLTSAYAPMGAVLVSDKVAHPFFQGGNTLLHGITFGGHPLSAVIALKNLEIFARERVIENVLALEPYLQEQLETLRDIRGAGFFWAVELVKGDGETRLTLEERNRILRGYLPRAMHEAGLIARADDRGDAIFQIAPPLVADKPVLDELVEKMRTVLSGAGAELGLAPALA